MLDLHAVKVHGDFQASNGIFAEKDAVVFLDVEAFDGKDIGGAAQFFSEEK